MGVKLVCFVLFSACAVGLWREGLNALATVVIAGLFTLLGAAIADMCSPKVPGPVPNKKTVTERAKSRGYTTLEEEAILRKIARETAAAVLAGQGKASQLPRQQVYVIEGEIGAGKTELLRAVSQGLEARGYIVCTIYEPVNQWEKSGALAAYYKDPAGEALGFQCYVYATRVLAIREAVKRTPNAEIYLLERSPASDWLFMELNRDKIGETRMQMYREHCTAWCSKQTPLPAPLDRIDRMRVLYLKPSLNTCMNRVSSRDRKAETAAESESADGIADAAATGVTLEYQRKLRKIHEAFFEGKGIENYPGLPANPFNTKNITVIEGISAESNFRDPSIEKTRTVEYVISLMGNFPWRY